MKVGLAELLESHFGQVQERYRLTMTSGLANDNPWGDRQLDADAEIVGDGGILEIQGVTASDTATADVVVANTKDKALYKLSFSLSPQVPPRIQAYEISPLPTPS
ncbi:MAG: hypothetical protein ACREP9_13695 [Candidatus Dormibacteraceae bacterium]